MSKIYICVRFTHYDEHLFEHFRRNNIDHNRVWKNIQVTSNKKHKLSFFNLKFFSFERTLY